MPLPHLERLIVVSMRSLGVGMYSRRPSSRVIVMAIRAISSTCTPQGRACERKNDVTNVSKLQAKLLIW